METLTIIDTLKYNLESSGILSGAPYLAMGFLLSIAGIIADMLINKRVLTITQVSLLISIQTMTNSYVLDKETFCLWFPFIANNLHDSCWISY